MDQQTLQVALRKDSGSSAAKKLRRAGRIPAIMYGHGEPMNISISEHEFRLLVHPDQYGSMMVDVRLDNVSVGTAQIKSVQSNPLKHEITSVDLQRVSQSDSVTIEVSIVLVGEAEGQRLGGVLEQMAHSVSLRCLVSDVPRELTHDISAMQPGDVLHAGDLQLPAGTELHVKPEETIAVLLQATVRASEATEKAEAAE